MADVRSHEAPSSTFYDISLSFRGKDTRYTFTDHLYTTLVRQGFTTFRDEDKTEKGENLYAELEKGICRSKISIIVISKDYASSKWCLDELVMILEQRKISGHEVLPVFYYVDPSQVREQTGRIGEAFAKYEKQFRAETDYEVKIKLMENIKMWRQALREVADLIGVDLQNPADRHESKIIQQIVQWVRNKLRYTTLDVASYEVGIDSQVKDINIRLQDRSTDVSIRVGMGGYEEKTTIALDSRKKRGYEEICSKNPPPMPSRTSDVFCTPNEDKCFECDLQGHRARDCPWKRTKCPKGCEGVMKLFISNTEESKGEKFLKCIICKKFEWLSIAVRKLEK